MNMSESLAIAFACLAFLPRAAAAVASMPPEAGCTACEAVFTAGTKSSVTADTTVNVSLWHAKDGECRYEPPAPGSGESGQCFPADDKRCEFALNVSWTTTDCQDGQWCYHTVLPSPRPGYCDPTGTYCADGQDWKLQTPLCSALIAYTARLGTAFCHFSLHCVMCEPTDPETTGG